MRIAITSAWNRAYQPIADITVPVMVEYAKKHGYSFRGWPDRYHTDEARDPSFLTFGDRAKLQIYKDLYNDFDVIVWLDVDTLVTNPEKRIEDILGARPFVWSVDHHGPLSGFTIARCIPPVHLALNTVLHRGRCVVAWHDRKSTRARRTFRSRHDAFLCALAALQRNLRNAESANVQRNGPLLSVRTHGHRAAVLVSYELGAR